MSHKQLMVALLDKHQPLSLLLQGKPLHYLDIPFYGNVGDLLIMSGTLRFFEREKLRVVRMGMYFNYDSKWARPNDVIVFQGGGNFGDIYGPFQGFRERVISELPGNRIVILPQTIYFENPSNFKRCCETFSRHPDLHICVRDHRSFELALQMTNNVYLMPDMAHQLWPITPSVADGKGVLRLFRRDAEISENRDPDFSGISTTDWDELVGKRWIYFLSVFAERAIYHAHKLKVNGPFANLEARLWINQAHRFIDRAIELFSKHKLVESDRLHAHILSCLLGMPNIISDNSYGKNHAYIDAWTKDSELVSAKQSGKL